MISPSVKVLRIFAILAVTAMGACASGASRIDAARASDEDASSSAGGRTGGGVGGGGGAAGGGGARDSSAGSVADAPAAAAVPDAPADRAETASPPRDAATVDGGAPAACDGSACTAAACAPAPGSPMVVDVKTKGAKGDGVTNDTAAIQAAIDAVAGTGGTVLVPGGTYMIQTAARLSLKSNMTFKLAAGATLKAITSNSANYDIVRVDGQSNVNIVGGTIEGERSTHQGTTGEWGMGIGVYASSKVVIDGVTTKETWGDGIYLGNKSKDITICGAVADHNRRQGMSLVSASGVTVKDSIFKNTEGTNPQSGIDFEPNTGEAVDNVTISGSQFLDNHSYGLEFYCGAGPVTNVTITRNTFSGNGDLPIELYAGCTGNKITNNILSTKTAIGISLRQGANNNTVTGNEVTFTGARKGQAVVDNGTGNTVSGNTVR
jgi:parallel beta-helix repeat protein